MKTIRTTTFTMLAAAILLASTTGAQLAPLDNREYAIESAHALLGIQFGSGAFPWAIGDPTEYTNVQGITAIGLLDAYTLSLDEALLAGATATRDWLDNRFVDPTARPSGSDVYFLAKYALLTLNGTDMQLAQDALDRQLTHYGNATNLAEYILTARMNQGHTNMGLWDVALFVRAAHDVGYAAESAEFAGVLVEQTGADGIVDALDANATWYELGLSGLLFGLSEADFAGNVGLLADVQDRLVATQCESGGFPVTYQSVVYCDEVQGTAYAVLGLTHSLGQPLAAQAGCDFLRSARDDTTLGWDLGGYEIAEVNSEAIQALVACVLPLHNGAGSYADPTLVELIA